jgi:plasmid maintenance system killer protein
MIKTFADKFTENIFQGIYTRKVHGTPHGLIKQAQRKLDLLNGLDDLESLRKIPAFSPDGYSRDSKDTYSIPIEGNWRLAFRWNENASHDVIIKT